MSGGISLATIASIATIAAGAAGIASSAGLFGGSKPKTPQPITAPPPPTVNQASQQADEQQAVASRKGALANLLTPSGTYGQQTQSNTSLKTVLGG